MKNLIVTVTYTNPTNDHSVEERKHVNTESAMWNYLRKVRDRLTDTELKNGVRAIVKEDNVEEQRITVVKDISFRRNSKGKIEMLNSIKEVKQKKVEPKKKRIKNSDIAPSGATMLELNSILADTNEMANAD